MRSVYGLMLSVGAAVFLAVTFWPGVLPQPDRLIAADDTKPAAVKPAAARPAALPAKAEALAAETDRDAQVAAKLAKPVTIEMAETPLGDVLDYLADKLGVQIYVKWRVLGQANLSKDTPVSMKLKDAPGDMVLDLLLADLNNDLTHTVQHGVLMISSKQDFAAKLVVQVYNVRDLLSKAVAAGEELTAIGEAIAKEDQASNSQKLMQLVRTTVAPRTWDENGGDGSLAVYNGLMVVNQSSAVHNDITALLRMLREAAAKPKGENAAAK